MVYLVIGTVALALFLNTMGGRLRDRVTVLRTADRLVVQNQQAALRLDAMLLALCLVALGGAVLARSPIAIGIDLFAVAVVGWRIVQARQAPVFVFDASIDAVQRDRNLVCNLSSVEGVEIVPSGQASALELHYRDPRGSKGRQLIHKAARPSTEALRATIADFLNQR